MGERICSVDGCGRPHHGRGLCIAHHNRLVRGLPLDGPIAKRVRGSLAERLWARVGRAGPDECWLYRGILHSNQYGYIGHGRKRLRAHRVAYELLVGPIPDGLVLDHLCRNKACCNPAHLEPVTIAENVRRGENIVALNARKTHCKRGHEFTPENTYVSPVGARICRACVALLRARDRAST